MKKLKWFSLIEMLIIISLILIFMVVFRSQLIPKNTHIYHWQACVNNLHDFISSFATAWLTNKWLYSGQQLIYPDKYQILIEPSENKIANLINSNNSIEEINLSWTISSDNICYINSSYKIFLTWSDLELEINKWQWNNQFNFTTSSWLNLNTWKTELLLCKNNLSECLQIWEYLIDKRSQTIIKRVCLAFSWSDCMKWNE